MRRITQVQYLLDDIYFYIFVKSSTKSPNGTTLGSLLHFPVLQHLVHHLWQAVAAVVMFYGFYFHLGQAQAPRASFPFIPHVLPYHVQLCLVHHMVLYMKQKAGKNNGKFSNRGKKYA